MRDLCVSVDLLAFFRTARFDCLRIGQSQELILHNFPDPDDWAARAGRDAGTTIWRYGNLELHFVDHALQRIFSDYVATLDGGPSIALDRWVLGDPAQRTLGAMMLALTRERIDFTKRTTKLGQIELDLASGVRLTFDDLRDPPEPPRDPATLPLVAFQLDR